MKSSRIGSRSRDWIAIVDVTFWTILFFVIGVSLCIAWCSKAEAVDRVEKSEIQYIGRFTLPPWRPGVRWGYGAQALTYDADRDALVGSAHRHFKGQVAWCSIPELGGRAEDMSEFMDIRGPLSEGMEFQQSPKLDSFGGLAIVEGKLWASFHTYYAVQTFRALDKPSFMCVDLEERTPHGLFKPGPYGDPVFGQKRTSNYLFAIPKRWADAHVGGKRLGAGKGDGAGNAGNSHGPPIYAVSTTPDDDNVLDAVALVHYPPNGGHFPWNKCDKWEGAVWVRGTVLIAGRRGTMSPECYGTPQACGDLCGGGKGYHCQPYRVDLLFYDEDDLSLVASGDMKSHEVAPYEVMDLTPSLENTCSYTIGGMAYDTRRGRLYLVQDKGESPIVHVWRVLGTDQVNPLPDPTPPPGPLPPRYRVTVTVNDVPTTFLGMDKTKVFGQAIESLAKELQKE